MGKCIAQAGIHREEKVAGHEEKSAELVTRLERLPFSRWHRNFFVLSFFGIMFDAMDFALFLRASLA
jgi:hypothetical protein